MLICAQPAHMSASAFEVHLPARPTNHPANLTGCRAQKDTVEKVKDTNRVVQLELSRVRLSPHRAAEPVENSTLPLGTLLPNDPNYSHTLSSPAPRGISRTIPPPNQPRKPIVHLHVATEANRTLTRGGTNLECDKPCPPSQTGEVIS
eukprot:1175514-Prorocentrum_minimum.AAC.2